MKVPHRLAKIEELLTQRNMAPLGFEPNSLPDENWAFRVIRYLDPANLCGAFKVPVRDSQLPDVRNSRM